MLWHAGNPKFVTGKGHNHHGHDSHNDEAPRPMSIKERVERDRQLEAAAGRGAPSDLHSAGGDTSESSWTTSAYTYNSMEPMEKSELAAAAMVSLSMMQTQQLIFKCPCCGCVCTDALSLTSCCRRLADLHTVLCWCHPSCSALQWYDL